MNRQRSMLIVVLSLVSWSPGSAADWHAGLTLNRGGWWSQRVKVTVANRAPQAVAGAPVAVAIGHADGQADLVGAAAEAVRVCDAAGVEMLWSLVAPDGSAIERGTIPDGATLTIPVERDAGVTADDFIYFDNPDAWAVPDFLPYQAGVSNGGVEQGQGDEPSGWQRDPPDPTHRTRWCDEQPHTGRFCLQTTVDRGAAPSWIGTRQSKIHVTGGVSYRLTAWVRADDVEGWAGWFVHVGNESQSQLLNQSLSAGDGTFGWKSVSATFTVPSGADRLTVGTVLRGTGAAWYDDVTLESLGEAGLAVAVGGVERRWLQQIDDDPAWPRADDGTAWSHRAELRMMNATNAAMTGQLWSVDLASLRHRLRRTGQEVLVTCGGQRVPQAAFGQTLVFEADVPPRSLRTGWVHFGSPPSSSTDAAERLSRHSLLSNGGFERLDGDGRRPADWTTQVEPGNRRAVVAVADSPGYASEHCVKLHVPERADNQWQGWHQDVPVEPDRTYLFGAWVRCQDIADGEVRLHGHVYDAQGELCRSGGYTSAGEPLTGTADWTWLWGTVRMPADAARYHVHLTMNASGTVWHDGAVLLPIESATVGDIETRVPSAPGLHAWQVNPIVKVFRDDVTAAEPSAPLVATISAARNEYEPVQLAVRSDVASDRLRVLVEAPRHASGAVLDDINVGVVGFVPVDYPSSYDRAESPIWHRKFPTHTPGCDGWSGWWPDPLLPTDTFDLAAQQTQPIWITLHVPQGAPAGDYRGEVRFLRGGTDALRVPLLVHVWDFDLPDETHLKAIYDVRFRTTWWPDEPEMRGRVTEQLWRMLAQHRLSSHEVSPAPTFDYRDGVATADFTEFDKAASHYFDELGMTHAYTPWHFYGFGWGHPPRTLFGLNPFTGKYPYEGADHTRLQPEWTRAYQACLKLFWEHVESNGWADRFTLYISDEPHFNRHQYVIDQMRALCEMIHEVDPQIPIYSSTWEHLPDWDGSLDVWGIGHDGRVPVEQMQKLRDGGATIWFTTDGQQCLDTPFCAVERLLPHYCFKYHAEAYEFWGVSWHTYDPYRWGWHRYIHQSSEPGVEFDVRYPNGDGYLIYPPYETGGLPVPSIRLEQAREGVEDYEYLHLLQTLMTDAQAAGIDPAEGRLALEQATGLVTIPNAGGRYSSQLLDDPDAVLQARRSVGQAIETLAQRLPPE